MRLQPTWRFLDTRPATGSRQMAIDEALLEAVACHGSPPVLHLFAFDPICLSLGRFQTARCGIEPHLFDGIHVVRRPTGGTAVLHAGDICYALAAPIDDGAVGGSLRRSYHRLALAFARALELLGASPDPIRDTTCGTASNPLVPRPSACFAVLGPSEVTVAGVKVVGSAQARRGRAFLQQGSLRLATDREREAHLLGGAPPSLADLLRRTITYDEAAVALRRAFVDVLNIAFKDSTLAPGEDSRAQELEGDRYASAAWTWER